MLASKQLTSANFKKRDFLVSGRNNPTPNPVAKRRERPPCTPFAAEPCRASAAPEANRTLILVRGKGLSEHSETRCSPWHSPRDVLALAAPCCGGDFFACAQCHDEVTGHVLQPWPSDTPLATHALLCGVCNTTFDIGKYLSLDLTRPRCPACDADFNPGCSLHHGLYFDQQLIARAKQAAQRKSKP
eukprot:2938589-Pyramimonas_sp.AAC.2